MKDAITRRAGVYARVSKEDITKKKFYMIEILEQRGKQSGIIEI